MERGGVYEMTIGDLADPVGVTARAIRHCESAGCSYLLAGYGGALRPV